VRTRRARWSQIQHVHVRENRDVKLAMLTTTLHDGTSWSAFAVADPLTGAPAPGDRYSDRVAGELEQARRDRGGS
jgi:hypothetical protein